MISGPADSARRGQTLWTCPPATPSLSREGARQASESGEPAVQSFLINLSLLVIIIIVYTHHNSYNLSLLIIQPQWCCWARSPQWRTLRRWSPRRNSPPWVQLSRFPQDGARCSSFRWKIWNDIFVDVSTESTLFRLPSPPDHPISSWAENTLSHL